MSTRTRPGESTRGTSATMLLADLGSAQSSLVNQNTGTAACGNELMRMGNEHPGRCPYTDGGGGVVGDDSRFARLTELIGAPELADTPPGRAPMGPAPTGRCATADAHGGVDKRIRR